VESTEPEHPRDPDDPGRILLSLAPRIKTDERLRDNVADLLVRVRTITLLVGLVLVLLFSILGMLLRVLAP
jgi:hypothetical protein